jgi:hypothetical protein
METTAAEERHHRLEEEVKQLKHANAVQERKVMQATKQLAGMRRKIEMTKTEHSRTMFDLRRKNEMQQVHYSFFAVPLASKPLSPRAPFSLL